MRRLIIVALLLVLSSAQEKSAAKAMLLCGLPGGGQFYTGRYVRGLIIAGGETTLGYFAIRAHFDNNRTERNSLLWYLSFVLGYSLADAYVGAKFYNFKAECDVDKAQTKLSFGFVHRW